MTDIVSSFIGANAAEGAAETQAEASRYAADLQKQIFDIVNQQQTGYRQRGESAANMLAMYLGIPGYTSGAPAGGAAVPGGLTAQQLRAQLLPQFTTSAEGGIDMQSGMPRLTQTINEQALQAEIQRRLAAQAQPAAAATQATVATNPLYGSLLQTFTGANLASEPGYQFGLSQGQQAIERGASARGGLYSGATLKALEKYGQDYGGTKFNEAFNRNLTQRQNIFNMLSGVSGTGQVANQQTASAGQNYATQAGNAAITGANAQAAAGLARGTQYGNALNAAGSYLPKLSSFFNTGNTVTTPTGLEGMNPNDLAYFFGGG